MAIARALSEEELVDLHRGFLSSEEIRSMERELRYGGGGRGPGHGGGGGMSNTEHNNIQFLLAHAGKIKRKVIPIKKGAKTITTSSNPAVATALKNHVGEMIVLVNGGRRIRWWDPLFTAILNNARKMTVKKWNLKNGVRAIIVGRDECSIALARSHAGVVTKFAKNGHSEAQRKHAAPKAC